MYVLEGVYFSFEPALPGRADSCLPLAMRMITQGYKMEGAIVCAADRLISVG